MLFIPVVLLAHYAAAVAHSLPELSNAAPLERRTASVAKSIRLSRLTADRTQDRDITYTGMGITMGISGTGGDYFRETELKFHTGFPESFVISSETPGEQLENHPEPLYVSPRLLTCTTVSIEYNGVSDDRRELLRGNLFEAHLSVHGEGQWAGPALRVRYDVAATDHLDEWFTRQSRHATGYGTLAMSPRAAPRFLTALDLGVTQFQYQAEEIEEPRLLIGEWSDDDDQITWLPSTATADFDYWRVAGPEEIGDIVFDTGSPIISLPEAFVRDYWSRWLSGSFRYHDDNPANGIDAVRCGISFANRPPQLTIRLGDEDFNLDPRAVIGSQRWDRRDADGQASNHWCEPLLVANQDDYSILGDPWLAQFATTYDTDPNNLRVGVCTTPWYLFRPAPGEFSDSDSDDGS